MKDRGGWAFPGEQGHTPDGIWNQTWDPGMTLRDWFAGQAPITWGTALQMCGFPNETDICIDSNRATIMAVMAMARFEYADAMLAERAK